MQLNGFVHANVNCPDFEVSRRFYERLGFQVVWDVNHLGIARLAFATRDLAGDLAELAELGATMVGPPVTISGPTGAGVSFACFYDPDGTVLELVQYGTAAQSPSSAGSSQL